MALALQPSPQTLSPRPPTAHRSPPRAKPTLTGLTPMQRPWIALSRLVGSTCGARSWRTPGFGPVVSERSASIRLLLLAGGGDSAVRRLFVLHSLAHGYGLMT